MTNVMTDFPTFKFPIFIEYSGILCICCLFYSRYGMLGFVHNMSSVQRIYSGFKVIETGILFTETS